MGYCWLPAGLLAVLGYAPVEERKTALVAPTFSGTSEQDSEKPNRSSSKLTLDVDSTGRVGTIRAHSLRASSRTRGLHGYYTHQQLSVPIGPHNDMLVNAIPLMPKHFLMNRAQHDAVPTAQDSFLHKTISDDGFIGCGKAGFIRSNG